MSLRLLLLLPVLSILAQSREYRNVTGYGNNIANPTWGQTGTPYIYKQGSVAYTNPASGTPRTDLPNARVISNTLFGLPVIHTTKTVSDALVYWGQFLVHTIMITGGSSTSMEIPIPTGDAAFDPDSVGGKTISFMRSSFSTASGSYKIINDLPAYLDGASVYGADPVRTNALRTFIDGKLKTSTGNNNDILLPLNTGLFSQAPSPDANRFFTGDIRGNENPILQSFHTLFVREHNRKAAELKSQGITDDETLFQEARAWVIALLQKITYDEYLPQRLGGPLPLYTGYDATVNAGIDMTFMTGPMRYGHSAINTLQLRVDDDRNEIPEGHLLLRDAFFNPSPIKLNGIEPLLRGFTLSAESAVDTRMVSDLRNLFNGSPRPAFDLAAVNIQRSRDHGAPLYNDARVALGLARINSWSDFPGTPESRTALQNLYGTIDKLESWVGGLAELPTGSSTMGPLFTASLIEQFSRIRSGDRFWYERDGVLRSGDLAKVKAAKLSNVILWNTNIKNMPDNVFRVSNPATSSSSSSSSSSSTSSSGCTTSTIAGLDCMITISTEASLHWSMSVATDTITLALAVTGTMGWAGLGVSPDGMVGSEVVIGMTTDVSPYTISAKARDAISKSTSIAITNGKFTQSSGQTVLQYTRAASSNGGTLGVKLASGTTTRLVFAYGSSTSYAYHGASRGTIDWSPSGTVTVSTSTFDAYKVAHGVLMASSWGVMLPLGMFSARFLKQKKPTSGPRAFWFVTHVTCQLTGTALALAGWIIALTQFSKEARKEPHGILGIITMVLGIVQVMNGLARPKHGAPMRAAWEKLHHLVGRVALLLAMPTIYLGLQIADKFLGSGINTWGMAVYSVVLAGMLITFVVFSATDISVPNDDTATFKSSSTKVAPLTGITPGASVSPF